jgi:gas vesicle protein
MERKDKKDSSFKVLYFVIAGMFIASLLIPTLYQIFIVGNDVPSKWDDTVWGGFLGSLWGGTIGGIGTLIAVIFTTRETRKIQKESKGTEEKKERTAFADDIVEYVGKYVTKINVYYYNISAAERINNEIKNLKDEWNKKEIETIESRVKLSQVDNYGRDVLYECNRLLPYLQHENDILIKKISDMESELKEHKADRTFAIECYFILKMKLSDIEISKKIIEKLDFIHTDLFKQDILWNSDKTNELVKLTEAFVSEYVL